MPLKTLSDEPPQLNLAPMIDILFLLIIFFVVGMRYSELNESERDLSVQVPEVAGAGTAPAETPKLIVNVLGEGGLEIDGRPATLEQLRGELRRRRGETPPLGVVIRGDAASSYQRVAEVIAACHEEQIHDLHLAVRLAAQQRP